MGILMSVYSVSASDLERIIAEPELAEHLWDCEPGSLAARDLPRELLDLDKAWAGIHFVLTGSQDAGGGALGFLLDAGEEIGDQEGRVMPIQGIRPEEVVSISAALAPISPQLFQERLDHRQLLDEGVYGVSDDEEEERKYLGLHYEQLRGFVARAAEKGHGLVTAG
ncbi:MAG TPA: DUF1877 family protein [Myxococcales bacterium]|nr:DUF1877 family protein [Myxococcales bacterium]